jgi:NAD(P)-dependent dehydrogenase (short-subunit alcohol dehydrogenase family)
MMKVLVTGATGFIGTHLVRHLRADGHEVRALVRPTSDTTLLEPFGVELAHGDVRDFDSVKDAVSGRDVVFHMAVSRHPTSKQGSGGRLVEHLPRFRNRRLFRDHPRVQRSTNGAQAVERIDGTQCASGDPHKPNHLTLDFLEPHEI